MANQPTVVVCPFLKPEEAESLRDRMQQRGLEVELRLAPSDAGSGAVWRAFALRAFAGENRVVLVEPSLERDPEGRYRREINAVFAEIVPSARAKVIPCSFGGPEAPGPDPDGRSTLTHAWGRSIGDLASEATLDGLSELLADELPLPKQVPLVVEPLVLSDHPALEDGIGQSRAALAFVHLISATSTVPPIVASIEGGWGVGKSSFLNLVRAEIRRAGWSSRSKRPVDAQQRDPPGVRTVWFNAWSSDGEASAFSSFALTLIEELDGRHLLQRLSLRVRLAARRFDWSTGWRDAATLAGGLLLVVLAIAIAVLGKLHALEAWVHKDVTWAQTATTALTAGVGWTGLQRLRNFFKSPLSIDLTKHVSSPDYESKRAQRDRLYDDIAKIIQVYSYDAKRVYVFVDDLDRADPAKVAEITQTISVILARAGGKLVYVLALDREKVAAAIAARHKEIAAIMSGIGPKSGQPLDFGQAFLEKLVQLPFRVPTPGAEELRTWIQRIVPHTVDLGEVVEMVAPFLGTNPRRIKQFVNLMHLRLRTLRAQDMPTPALSLHQLGKLTAVEILYPFFINDLVAAPALLNALLIGAGADTASESYRRWSARTELVELLIATLPCESGPLALLQVDRNTSLLDLDLRPVLRIVLRAAGPLTTAPGMPSASSPGSAELATGGGTAYAALARYAREYEHIRETEAFSARRTTKLDRLFNDMASVRGLPEFQAGAMLDSGSAGLRIAAIASLVAERYLSMGASLCRILADPKSPFEIFHSLRALRHRWSQLSRADQQAVARLLSTRWLAGAGKSDPPIWAMTQDLLRLAEDVALDSDIQIALPDGTSVRLDSSELTSFNVLTDTVFAALAPRVRPYFYGTEWRLVRDDRMPLKHARELTHAGPGKPVSDARSLSEAGVTPGARLHVELLN